MKLMSFFHTQQQIRDKTKTVTRRAGRADLKPGEHFMAIVQGQGLKRGEKVQRLAELICVSNAPEAMNRITEADCIAEGFPDLSPPEFVEMFCKHMGGEATQIVNRIEFTYA